ncbi:MAG: XdhC family protein [Rhodobacteraceae bacterium]|nr:XdhC family protein [Paracoccaceae bacterium]
MKQPLSDPDTYAEHAVDVLDAAVARIKANRPFALITSVGIQGGAAREEGTLALADLDGPMTGYLSNGCIDRDIQLRAVAAIEAGRKEIVRYGEGSRFVDLKLPCGGALDVLLDPDPDRAMILAAQEQLSARRAADLVFSGPKTTTHECDQFGFRYAPRIRLCLAGRGAIFRSMAVIGQASGFDVALMSPDAEDLAAVGHLSVLAPVHMTGPNHVGALDMLDQHSAFLTLFHDHDWEPYLLKHALEQPVGFVGALGSRRTQMMRLETLRQIGVPDPDIARLRGPIGLVGSLRDASMIAVSALAEIVQTFPSQIEKTTCSAPPLT